MSENQNERQIQMQAYLQTLLMFNPQWTGGDPLDKSTIKPKTYAEFITEDSHLLNGQPENGHTHGNGIVNGDKKWTGGDSLDKIKIKGNAYEEFTTEKSHLLNGHLENGHTYEDDMVNGFDKFEINGYSDEDHILNGFNKSEVISNRNNHRHLINPKYPVEIAVNEGYGLELIATRDIEPGEVIFQEPPLLLGPVDAEISSCLACLAPTYKDSTSVCPACRGPLCSTPCKGTGHRLKECEILARNDFMSCENSNIVNSLYNILTPLRTLLLMSERDDVAKVLEAMEANVKKRSVLRNGFKYEDKIATALQLMGVAVDQQLVKAICGVWDTNAYTVYIGPTQQDPAQAIFPVVAMMNHSCVSNTYVKFAEGFMIVRASLAIPKGTALTNSYRHMLYGTRHRRKFFLESKLFLCKCPRCVDPTECNSHASSIRCQKCPQGLYVPPRDHSSPWGLYVPSSDHTSPWLCYKCNHPIPAKLADTLVTSCFVACSKVDTTDIQLMVAKLNLVQEGLGTQHYLCQELKRLIIAAITSNIMEDRSSAPMGVQTDIIPCNELSDGDLWLLLDLSEELLKMGKLIEPGMSGFRGQLLMHQVRAATELMTRSYYHLARSQASQMHNDRQDEKFYKVQKLTEYQIQKQVLLDSAEECVNILMYDPLYKEAKKAQKCLKNLLENSNLSQIIRP